ncbi:MAG: glycosyltransferase [Elusimicrobia bacterium]|nr:glycosyltransferase [Elusimicrobiota bacterium]
MSWIIALLTLWTGALLVGLGLSVAASWRHFRKRTPPVSSLALTVIRPIKGADEGLAAHLESLVLADQEGRLQILLAMEGERDPAHAVAREFARSHPERDIEIVLSGPNPGRMGKMHNMIEALPKAKHPFIVFTDADTGASPELLAHTQDAFASGAEAVFALPYHGQAPGLAGLLLRAAVNHSFGTSAALFHRLGRFMHFSGAWMGYRRDLLERMGGLEPFSRVIADDFSLGSAAVRAGARLIFLSVPARLRESDQSLSEVLAHLGKWAAIIHCALPGFYWFVPLLSPGNAAAALWLACELSAQNVALGRAALAACLIARPGAALIQDLIVEGEAMPAGGYALVALQDIGALLFWLSGFRSHIEWRGSRYRLRPGGSAELLG